MADHTPRLCDECNRPLSALQKRLRPWLCARCRLVYELTTIASAGGGFWA